MEKKLSPFLVRALSSQGQITIPQEYLKALDVSGRPANWKVILNKSKKVIKLELL